MTPQHPTATVTNPATSSAATLSTNSIDTALWVLLTWLVVRWVRTRHNGLRGRHRIRAQ